MDKETRHLGHAPYPPLMSQLSVFTYRDSHAGRGHTPICIAGSVSDQKRSVRPSAGWKRPVRLSEGWKRSIRLSVGWKRPVRPEDVCKTIWRREEVYKTICMLVVVCYTIYWLEESVRPSAGWKRPVRMSAG
jgi:hypothetical protein